MSISRRKFLKTGTIAAATVGLPLKGLATETLEGNAMSSALPNAIRSEASRLNSAAFKRCINTTFRAHVPGADAQLLKLVKVSFWHPEPVTTTDRECFSNFFTGPTRNQLIQGAYIVEHESLGKFQMFVVPIGKKDGEFVYEALFNRLY